MYLLSQLSQQEEPGLSPIGYISKQSCALYLLSWSYYLKGKFLQSSKPYDSNWPSLSHVVHSKKYNSGTKKYYKSILIISNLYCLSGKCQRRGEFLKHSKHLKILSPSLLLLLFCTWMSAFPPNSLLHPETYPVHRFFFPSHVPISLTCSLLCKSISHTVLYRFFPLFYSIPRLPPCCAVSDTS